MIDKYIIPQRIVVSENVENKEELMIEKPLQPNFTWDDCAVIKKGGFVLLDFGREICGGAVLVIQGTSKSPKTGKCRLVFGESVMESLSGIEQKNAQNAHAVRDTVLDVASVSVVRYGNTGFRFLKIEAVDCNILLKAIKAEVDIKDIEYKGSFISSDERLNKIWETGAYTVQLNMHEFLWDGIKRDRMVWMGDIHPEMSTIRAVFGYDDCVVNSFDFVKKETSPDKWMNGIASYSIWWIINQYDWYLQQGDKDYLREQVNFLENLIQHVIGWIDNGFIATEDMECFVDWSSKDTQSEIEGLKSIFCIGLECAAKIFDEFNMSSQSRICIEYSEKLRNDVSDVVVNKGVAGLNILAKRNIDQSRTIIDGNCADEMSCFMGFYTICAKAELGDVDDALDIIREYWGGMIEMGATTFWEDFDIKWMDNSGRIDEIIPDGKNDIHGDFGKYCYKQFRHSLCHGWAGGPTAFLSKYVLGVNIAEAGCKKIIIKPNLCDLEWVKGTYPTPYGIISIEHKMENGRRVSKVDAPDEIEIQIL